VPTPYIYPSFARLVQNGGIDLDTDTLKVALVTSSYTYSASHDYFDDITNEVTGTGYSAGGATASSPTLTTTLANSWATTWAAATAYTLNHVIRPTVANGYLYQAVIAGTSHASTQPTWSTTRGINNTDNSVTWLNIGAAVTVFDLADTTWSTATITARGAVLYKSTGTAGTSPLICFMDFDSNVTSTGATFTVQWPSQGIMIGATA